MAGTSPMDVDSSSKRRRLSHSGMRDSKSEPTNVSRTTEPQPNRPTVKGAAHSQSRFRWWTSMGAFALALQIVPLPSVFKGKLCRACATAFGHSAFQMVHIPRPRPPTHPLTTNFPALPIPRLSIATSVLFSTPSYHHGSSNRRPCHDRRRGGG